MLTKSVAGGLIFGVVVALALYFGSKDLQPWMVIFAIVCAITAGVFDYRRRRRHTTARPG